MSESITFANGATARIYGTLTGALAYLGAQSDAWDDVATDEPLQRLLVQATRYIERRGWIEEVATFDLRDALDLGTGDGDAAFPFRAAVYELAELARNDAAVLQAIDTGSNIQSLGAGGASLSFFAPTSAREGTALPMPKVIMDLVGAYLASGGAGTSGIVPEVGGGQASCAPNPWADKVD